MSRIVYFFVNYCLLNSSLMFVLPLFFKTKEEYDRVGKFVLGNKYHILLGVCGLLSSFLALFFPVSKILIIGDILPVAVLLCISFLNIFGYVRFSNFLDSQLIQKGDRILYHLQIPLGVLGIIAGTIHIFFAEILLL